jgi:hypothetical protein
MPLPITRGALSARGFGLFSAPATVLDPYFPYVTMLLHGDGTNGAQNNTFLDSSTNNFSITRNGNTTQGSFSPYGSNWSNYFDTSSYLSVASDLVGSTTSTFTVDGWVYLTATPTSTFEISAFCGLSGQGNGPDNYMSFGPTSDSKITLRWFDGITKSAKSTNTLALNTWYYIACVVNSNAISMFINGVSETVTGTTTLNNRSGTVSQSHIGGKAYTYATLAGYISNVRVSSVARTITAQTAPFTSDANTTILTCQSNRFRDNSTNAFTVTANGTPSVQRFSPFSPSAAYSTSVIGGSGYFDGSGDYLALASNSAFDLGSGDFTIEFWMNTNASQTPDARVIGNWNNDGWAANKWSVHINHSSPSTPNQVAFWVYNANSSNQLLLSTTTVNGIGWVHVAIVRSGTSWALFINGSRQATATSSAAMSSGACPIQIGGTSSAGEPVTGYITDVRMVKGTAVYSPASTTITVPTAPLTAISGTSLLTNFTNGGIFDNAMMNDLETVGNAQISTSVFKYGTGSLAFDGTGDVLISKEIGGAFTYGTGNYTIECWLYPTTGATNQRTILGRESTGDVSIPYIYLKQTSGYLAVYYSSDIASTSAAISQNTWTHVAVSRASGTTRIFVNGVQDGTGADTTNLISPNFITIGASGSGAALPFTGYIDDLRITKGYARYTANFTPPTQAFPNQ